MHLLEVEKLTKFFGGLAAVNNVSFKVDEGEIIGLIGPNGAGKTTLFNLITGFIKPDSGKVKFRGEDITSLSPHRIVKRGIARTFQLVRHFPHLPVITHVTVSLTFAGSSTKVGAPKNPEREASNILDIVGLSEKMFEQAEHLSHGDLKRLEIARALGTRPDLLLLDEPFSGLNPIETEYLTKSIQRLHLDGHTLVIVEHKLHALMKLVKKVIVLHYGEKIAEGSPEEIAKNKKVIEVYMGRAI